ncbi:hypothetical protein ACYF6T_18155 [Streptomyces sp. 7R007]
MYGHGAPAPTRSASTVIGLRVLIAAVGFLSCGVLACVPLFRVAFLRGRRLDWAAAWASLPVSIVCFAVVGSVRESDVRGDIAMSVVLVLGALAATYFVITDIRVANERRRPPGYAPPQAPTVPSVGYGYPQPGPVQPLPPMQPAPQPPLPQTPIPGPPVSHGPVPPPPPQRPAPARIDQVRAELDELSDYLRRHEGNHEGGR